MREIKFRVWDGKRLEYSPALGTGIGTTIDGWFGMINYLDQIAMQYTGLKDKNGKDIYDGDILKIESEKLMVVGWSEKFASFTLNREGWMFSHWFGESCDPESCIVVGNIHENPYLL